MVSEKQGKKKRQQRRQPQSSPRAASRPTFNGVKACCTHTHTHHHNRMNNAGKEEEEKKKRPEEDKGAVAQFNLLKKTVLYSLFSRLPFLFFICLPQCLLCNAIFFPIVNYRNTRSSGLVVSTALGIELRHLYKIPLGPLLLRVKEGRRHRGVNLFEIVDCKWGSAEQIQSTPPSTH